MHVLILGNKVSSILHETKKAITHNLDKYKWSEKQMPGKLHFYARQVDKCSLPTFS